MTATLLDRPAAMAMACAAAGLADDTGLREALEAIGAITPPPRRKAAPVPRARRTGWSLRPWRILEPPPTFLPHGACPLPGCDRPAPPPGVPCDECWAALDGFTRPLEVAR